MKTINILGSTGVIGQKALQIIDKEFKKYKINYLLANNNYKLLAKQANYFKPKYLGIININSFSNTPVFLMYSILLTSSLIVGVDIFPVFDLERLRVL